MSKRRAKREPLKINATDEQCDAIKKRLFAVARIVEIEHGESAGSFWNREPKVKAAIDALPNIDLLMSTVPAEWRMVIFDAIREAKVDVSNLSTKDISWLTG